MGTRSRRLLLTLVALCGFGCAPFAPPPATVRCGTPSFDDAGGWLGGDAAYSIPLSPGRSLWLFGDTFVGTPDQKNRVGAHFVHNSIAISRCSRTGALRIDYFWTRAQADAAPRAFLDSGEAHHYWWLFDGFVHAGALYLGLLEVEDSEPRGPLGLPFRYTGMSLARIANPAAAPTEWRVDVLELSRDPIAFPASAMVVDGDSLYLFTFVDRDATHYPRILTRLPLAALERAGDELPERLETLARDGSWRSGLDVENARIIMDDDASEMSVRFHPRLGRWIALYNYPALRPGFPEVPPSDVVWLRSAARVEGPWSEPTPIYHIPELRRSDPDTRDPNTFCYAAKEHPQFARAGTLFFTYVCNLFTPPGGDAMDVLARLLRRMDLYRPVPVSLPLEAIPPEALRSPAFEAR